MELRRTYKKLQYLHLPRMRTELQEGGSSYQTSYVTLLALTFKASVSRTDKSNIEKSAIAIVIATKRTASK